MMPEINVTNLLSKKLGLCAWSLWLIANNEAGALTQLLVFTLTLSYLIIQAYLDKAWA